MANRTRSPGALWQRIQRMRPHFARLRRHRRYRYAAVALIGAVIGAALAVSVMAKRTTYADCILAHMTHASSQMAAYQIAQACEAKYGS